ncbi:MAG TPA: 30S ribosomal protein S30 [Polaromonas sp.]|uniref:HPF/RaiA family ribosome-associated protein n=1 Tax=Polaromonas sp. UBA4122 TaxID=1947074 RepID=UPI000EBC5028|nr:HPF/RaiA family ribosome-associated protein [Polaromonas sp. UBA4122]HAL37325.1 30S ribosomal protein S30 [Polaromonas sp.]
MKLPVHIQFRGMEPSDALEISAREHAHRLESFAPNIMACRVCIDLEQKHKHQGRPYGVRIDLTLPGQELVVNRVQHEDVYVALRDAFDNMKRQLEDVVRKSRGQEKQHTVPLHGEVVRLDDAGGFGFIRTPDGDEYYFSRDNLAGTPFEHVQTGSAVQFIPEVAGEGLQAKRVSLGKHGMG